MPSEPVLLDTDTLSELSRGSSAIVTQARAYLVEFGRFTISAVTVFERSRGYRDAIQSGKPFERQLQAFQSLVNASVVLPFDDVAADAAATIWAGSTRRARRNLGDLLIAAIAVSRKLPLVTRNLRDFEVFRSAADTELRLVDWARSARR